MFLWSMRMCAISDICRFRQLLGVDQGLGEVVPLCTYLQVHLPAGQPCQEVSNNSRSI